MSLIRYADERVTWFFRAAMMAIIVSVGCIEIPQAPSNENAGEPPARPDPGQTLEPSSDNNPLNNGELRPNDRENDDAPAPVVLPENCDNHCDCPGRYDCINKRCVLGEQAIYCCSHPDCPGDEECWTMDGEAGTCVESAD